MTEWEPATETEAAMRDALRGNDQELYFRILARAELLLPVSAQAIAGRVPMGWGTWTTGGRTHVLAFTSVAAVQACLAENAGSTRRTSYRDLAAAWPNHEWWLAVNPGLPIEGYLPAWFIAQLARGDVRLPGRPIGARTRLEQVENAARARATATVPGQASPGEQRGVVLSPGDHVNVPSAPVPAPAGAPVTPAPYAPPPVPFGTAAPATRPGEPVSAALVGPTSEHALAAWVTATTSPPPAEDPTGGRLGHQPGVRHPSTPTTAGRAAEAFAAGRAAQAGATGRIAGGQGGFAPTSPPVPPHQASGSAVGFDARGRTQETGTSGPGSQWSAFGDPSPRRNGTPALRADVAGRRDDPAVFAQHDTNIGSMATAMAPPQPAPPSAAVTPTAFTPVTPTVFEPISPEPAPQDRTATELAATATSAQASADTSAETSPEAADSEQTVSMAADSAPAGSTAAGETSASADAVAPVPPGFTPANDFTPANEVERNLLAATGEGRTDSYLSTLLLAKVLMPVSPASSPGTQPGEKGFVWRTEAIDGATYIVVFTSPQRLKDHLGEGVETVTVRFARLIQHWPQNDWSFAVNPGTPVGARFPGSQIVALANWAAEVGLGAETSGSAQNGTAESAQAVADRADESAADAVDSVPGQRPGNATTPEDPNQPTVMQKTVAPNQVAYYLERGYDRVSGFVHRASEIAHLDTPAKLYAALGLGYPGSPFSRDADEVYVLRWPAYRPSLYRIPYGGQNETAMRAMEGWVIERPPFRGNGFAPGENSDVVAEFKVDSIRLPHGSRLCRLGADGTDKLVAVLDTDARVWQRVTEE